MSVEKIKDMTKSLIIDSLVTGGSFHCLKCEKEIKRDTKKAEFTTPHILIEENESHLFVCSTCYNQRKYRPTSKEAYFYRKCASSKCSNRFYFPLNQKDATKFCSDACMRGENPDLKKNQLYIHQVMLWQVQGYALYTFTKSEWCIMVQEQPKIWKIGFYLTASLESIEKLATLESKVSGLDSEKIQQKITANLKHTSYRHIF